nr:MAG TPA: hypothetical protein [Caudoviricetes sp.]
MCFFFDKSFLIIQILFLNCLSVRRQVIITLMNIFLKGYG